MLLRSKGIQQKGRKNPTSGTEKAGHSRPALEAPVHSRPESASLPSYSEPLSIG